MNNFNDIIGLTKITRTKIRSRVLRLPLDPFTLRCTVQQAYVVFNLMFNVSVELKDKVDVLKDLLSRPK